jgi:hypothetical protein
MTPPVGSGLKPCPPEGTSSHLSRRASIAIHLTGCHRSQNMPLMARLPCSSAQTQEWYLLTSVLQCPAILHNSNTTGAGIEVYASWSLMSIIHTTQSTLNKCTPTAITGHHDQNFINIILLYPLSDGYVDGKGSVTLEDNCSCVF